MSHMSMPCQVEDWYRLFTKKERAEITRRDRIFDNGAAEISSYTPVFNKMYHCIGTLIKSVLRYPLIEKFGCGMNPVTLLLRFDNHCLIHRNVICSDEYSLPYEHTAYDLMLCAVTIGSMTTYIVEPDLRVTGFIFYTQNPGNKALCFNAADHNISLLSDICPSRWPEWCLPSACKIFSGAYKFLKPGIKAVIKELSVCDPVIFSRGSADSLKINSHPDFCRSFKKIVDYFPLSVSLNEARLRYMYEKECGLDYDKLPYTGPWHIS